MVLNLTGKDFIQIGNKIGRNVIIFGVDMTSSAKIDNRKKDILILGKDPTQGLEHTLGGLVRKNCIQLTLLTKKQSFI